MIYTFALQGCTIIVFFKIVGCDCELLFVEDVNCQAASIIDHILGHSTAITGYHMVISPAVQIAGIYRISITNAQVLFLLRLAINRLIIHVPIIDRKLSGNEIIVLEDQDIVLHIG